MEQYFKIDNQGRIINTEFFEKGNEEKEYKQGWGDEVFFDPRWSFKENKWVDAKSIHKILEDLKDKKIEQLNRECRERILDGFYYEIDGDKYHFSYDKEAQANMAERWQLFQNDMIQEIKVTAHTNDKDVRLTFDKKGYNDLYLASVKHKENCISHYRDDLLPLVEQALTVEQVEAINWDTVVTEPVPSLVIVEDKNTLDKQVDKVKVEQAQGNIELLQLIFSMGGM